MLVPGTYLVTNVNKFPEVCKNWVLPQACQETKDIYGNVLLVNGLTNQIVPAPASAVIWEQQIPVSETRETYRICFRYLPLPQCCFDVVAKPTIKVTSGTVTLGLTDVSDVDTGCGRLFSATYEAGGLAVNLSIILPQQNAMGDGNDLAIDNISVAKIVKIPSNLLTFSTNATAVVDGNFDVTSVIPTGLDPSCTWDWELYRGNAPNVMDPALFTLVQPGPQSNQTTSTFTGLPEKDVNGVSILYWVKLTVECDCSKGGVYRAAGQLPALRKLNRPLSSRPFKKATRLF